MRELIEKQAAVDAVNNAFDRETCLTRFVRSIAVRAIRDMPSAQPNIDKRELVRTITAGIVATSTKDVYSCGMRNGMRWCRALLEEGDPKFEDASLYAQPEITRCKECRFSEYDALFNDRYCHYNGKAEIVGDEHFCGYGRGGAKMRPIDADKLFRRMQRVATEAWKMNLTAKVEPVWNQAMDYIRQAPTIEPRTKSHPVVKSNGKVSYWACEHCGEPLDKLDNFCSNCGADLREETE